MSDLQHSLISYGSIVAALAMLIRAVVTRGGIDARYRPAIAASLGALSVAFMSYVLLVVELQIGYRRLGAVWVPNGHAIWAWSTRYMDWSVSVPLLVAISSLRGRTISYTRTAGVIAAFLMIATGYLGGVAHSLRCADRTGDPPGADVDQRRTPFRCHLPAPSDIVTAEPLPAATRPHPIP